MAPRFDFLRRADVKRVFDLLSPIGGGFLVGGAVRDAMMGLDHKDLDFATPATPDRVLSAITDAGLKAIPIGVEYGVVGVEIGGEVFEITTFRKDVATDGRRAVTEFGSDLAEDAQRRDFTMNALYLSEAGQVIDVVDGVKDIEARRLRFVGDAEQRIREDRLRALRFFRFMARFGDDRPEAHAEGIRAVSRFADDLDILSKERVGGEVSGIMKAQDPSFAIRTMAQIGMWKHLMLNENHDGAIAVIRAERELGLAPDWRARLAATDTPERLQPLLKLNNADTKQIRDMLIGATHADPAVSAHLFGSEAAMGAVRLRKAYGMSTESDYAERILAGASASFPIAAQDLPDLSGKALGEELRRLKTEWLFSGMVASKADLLGLNDDTLTP